MPHSNGHKMLDCPYCETRYLRNNRMLLKGWRLAKDNKGRLLSDTHLRRCYIERVLEKKTPPVTGASKRVDPGS